jgi:DNA-binding Lrp family transcriptional regulator
LQPAETVHQEKGLNSDMAGMVELIGELGPRVPEIARRMGRHKETVRYWFKKLQDHDFAISGIVNHEALGLRRIVMKVGWGDGFSDYVKHIASAMNSLCYLVSYSKALPEDLYVIQASIPEEFSSEYVDFIETLKQENVFKSVEYYMLDWVRQKPMASEYFDFEHGLWDFDFQSFSAERASLPPFVEPVVSPRVKFDKIDLLIAKELQRDATRELQEIQTAIRETNSVDINYKTLCWHLASHVEPRLLKGYKTNWMGTTYDPKTDRVKQRQHSNLAVDILVKSVRSDERAEVLRRLDALPTLWMEGAGSDLYAQVVVPSVAAVEGLQYLQSAIHPVSDRTTFLIADQRYAGSYSISYTLFDEETKSWRFNREELLAKFRTLRAQIS